MRRAWQDQEVQAKCSACRVSGASPHLHQHVAEGDAAQQRAGRAVVEDAQAVRARLPRVHEQVVQRPRAQVRVLRARPLFVSCPLHNAGHCALALLLRNDRRLPKPPRNGTNKRAS